MTEPNSILLTQITGKAYDEKELQAINEYKYIHQPSTSHTNFVTFFLNGHYLCSGALVTSDDILLAYTGYRRFKDNIAHVDLHLRGSYIKGVKNPRTSPDGYLTVVKVSNVTRYKRL